ncbi:glycoside hydrolase family 2 protein, partial [Kineococcus glutinatus]|uniref:glycoside hydrolase family 2 protein n=1 Tax=Kineococcus glutinatus TaxID=1070872 RepID=UPI003CD07975
MTTDALDAPSRAGERDGAPVAVATTSLDSAAGVTWTLLALAGPLPEAAAALRGAGVPATVPGVVHTDLLAAGAIADPFDGDNEARLAWIGRTGWSYRAVFGWTPDGRPRQELVAHGLDTVAVLRLNGTEVGRAANQHRTHRFDVTGLLREGDNELVVEFEAPVDAAERLAAEQGPRPHVNHHPFNAVRKTASNFGWDWGIDVATVGIWRSLALESTGVARIRAVRPLAGVDGGRGVLTAHVDVERVPGAQDATGTVVVEVAGRATRVPLAAGAGTAVAVVEVPDAQLWWPRGYGGQPLYDVAVRLELDAGPTDTWSGRVGFRTVTLDVAPDEHGSPFTVSVNGRPVNVRGANWIPDDAFLPRLDRGTYERGVRDAVEANMNLLRVWGGGIYESEDFYDLCDEQGVLVWQDFLFACAAYPEEEPLRSEVEAEAREAVTRLSRHASLALWNGGNENVWGYVEWGWRVPLAGRTWGAGYYLDLLPRIVAELDPRTPYSAASPFSYTEYLHPNDPRHGTVHIWDVWNSRDYSAYREYAPRFVSEFGF